MDGKPDDPAAGGTVGVKAIKRRIGEEVMGGNAMTRRSFVAAAGAGALAAAGCRGRGKTVVVYTPLDEMFSAPILEEWGRRMGVKVAAAYDSEAAKTTGLVTRLLAERGRPRADVFWNNEIAQTLGLKQEGVLAPHASPAAAAIPARWKDAAGYWTGFAARLRVIIYNSKLVTEPPRSLMDLTRPEWAGQAAFSNPLFGTAATHAAALFAAWGDERAGEFFRALKNNRVAIVPGNAVVRDLVARGEYRWGFTDTDDACGAVEDGLAARWLVPDQEDGGLGALVIPNTVALVAGGPNPEGGKALIDYLLSPEVEVRLARLRSRQIPLNPAVEPPEGMPRLAELRAMDVAVEAMGAKMAAAAAFVQKELMD
jgi:iron(III) transport system substrate-binding protein